MDGNCHKTKQRRTAAAVIGYQYTHRLHAFLVTTCEVACCEGCPIDKRHEAVTLVFRRLQRNVKQIQVEKMMCCPKTCCGLKSKMSTPIRAKLQCADDWGLLFGGSEDIKKNSQRDKDSALRDRMPLKQAGNVL